MQLIRCYLDGIEWIGESTRIPRRQDEGYNSEGPPHGTLAIPLTASESSPEPSGCADYAAAPLEAPCTESYSSWSGLLAPKHDVPCNCKLQCLVRLRSGVIKVASFRSGGPNIDSITATAAEGQSSSGGNKTSGDIHGVKGGGRVRRGSFGSAAFVLAQFTSPSARRARRVNTTKSRCKSGRANSYVSTKCSSATQSLFDRRIGEA